MTGTGHAADHQNEYQNHVHADRLAQQQRGQAKRQQRLDELELPHGRDPRT